MTPFVSASNRSSLEKCLPWMLGLSLGAAAFTVDELPWTARTLLVPLVSSGFSWGAVALVAGYFAARPILTLMLATFANYTLQLLVGQHWQNTFTEDGSSAAPMIVAGIGRALIFWLIASVAPGC